MVGKFHAFTILNRIAVINIGCLSDLIGGGTNLIRVLNPEKMNLSDALALRRSLNPLIQDGCQSFNLHSKVSSSSRLFHACRIVPQRAQDRRNDIRRVEARLVILLVRIVVVLEHIRQAHGTHFEPAIS